MTSPTYILLDRKNSPLTRGTLECPPDAPRLYVRVSDELIPELTQHELIQLIGVTRDLPSLLGRIVGSRRDVLILEPSESLAENVRQNLRVPVNFDTFLYPLTGTWRGRRYIISHDLSCGGISFYCRDPLSVGEQCEVVIPITSQPLILRCELLRVLKEQTDRGTLYAAKFVDLCPTEETITREAIFNIQLQNHPR